MSTSGSASRNVSPGPRPSVRPTVMDDYESNAEAKISPLEIDEVLLRHDDVAQAVTFAVPHDKLGEDTTVAVVLVEGATTAERELRDFMATSLAAFKVLRQVIVVDELPKGSTGKLQRVGLADRLGLGC